MNIPYHVCNHAVKPRTSEAFRPYSSVAELLASDEEIISAHSELVAQQKLLIDAATMPEDEILAIILEILGPNKCMSNYGKFFLLSLSFDRVLEQLPGY
jgi:hypothetical protein